MPIQRIERVNELIKREVSRIILQDIEFPQDTLVTVTRVDGSLNLIEAKVFVSVMPEEKFEQVFKIINSRIFDIQQQINKNLKMRPVPKIIFRMEKATSQADRIEKLLEEIKPDLIEK